MFFQKKFKDPSNSSKLNAITSCCVHLSWNTSINFAKRFSRITWPLVHTYPLDKHSNLMQLPNVVYRNNCMLFRNNYKLPDCNLMLKIRTKILFFFSRIFMLRKGKGGKRAPTNKEPHKHSYTPTKTQKLSPERSELHLCFTRKADHKLPQTDIVILWCFATMNYFCKHVICHFSL